MLLHVTDLAPSGDTEKLMLNHITECIGRLEALIQKGGKKLVNNVDKFGRHSLSILLLQLSRNFESVEDKDSQEALVDEAFRVVRLLVKNGADVNKKDLSGRRPRYYARLIRKITRRYTKKIDRYLKDRGGKKR